MNVNYTYDGDGRRVMKDSGKLYWTGMGSDPLTETDLSGNPTADYVFFDGKRIARVDLPSGAVHYYFSDNLGSASVGTSATGTIEQESDYYPYGGERVLTAGPNNYKFTSKERDGESGLDYFGARHYSSANGRFMVPDWAARPTSVPYADFGDPQSLNLYGYVRNDPISRADADGHQSSEWVAPHHTAMYQDPTGDVVDPSQITSMQIQAAELALQRAAEETGMMLAAQQNGQNQNQNQQPLRAGAATSVVPLANAGAEGAATSSAATTSTLSTLGPLVGAAAAVVVSASALIINVTDTLVENARGREQLAAVESVVHAENSRLLQMSAEHTQNKQKKNADRHAKPRPGRSTTKDRQKPGWKPRTPPRPQDLERN